MIHQGASQSPSTGVVQNYTSMKVMHRDESRKRDVPLFINMPETTRLPWKVILFQNSTHSVTDHALGLSPLQIHSLQAWERWGVISSLLTLCPHAKNEGPDGSLPGGKKQPLVSIIAFKNGKRNPSDFKD